MRAGDLNNLIEFQSYTSTKNNFNEVIEVWGTLHATRASIRPMTAKEKFLSAANRTEQYYVFSCRFVPGIKENMRILFNGELYDIESVINVKEQQRELEIVAKKQFN